jgi:peptide/nickel transport system permease protein
MSRRSPGVQIMVGLVLVLTIMALALVGPFLAPHPPSALVASPFEQAGPDLWLGADALGRDVLSRFLSGGLNLIWMAAAAAASAMLIGTTAGLTAAYLGRWPDEVIMRAVDLVMAFPAVVFALLFVTMFGRNAPLLVALVAFALAPGVARVARGAALGILAQDYVQWARAVGLPASRIILREVLPNIVAPLSVELGLRLMWAVSLLSALSFLGYGLPPPTADWGLMINENRNAIAFQPWSVIAPVLAIASLATGCNLIAEGVARHIGRTEGRRV